jgi:hypothetical protein
VLGQRAEFLARFASEQHVQTNEVGRAWSLLPALLSLGVERLDLIEPGASAGLLLCLDRFGYRYRAGLWGDGALVLTGADDGGPPASLLSRQLEIVRRRGIDRAPVDVTADEGARLLEAFVWADQRERVERLKAAIAIVRKESPTLLRGDYLELLPGLLEERAGDALTVVLTSMTTAYLDEQRYGRFLGALDRAGADGPLAWVSFEAPRGDREFDGAALEVTVWPGGRSRRLAAVDYHGAWLRWFAT